MADARVARINVTPVKSLRLNHPDEIELVLDGAREDRRFLLVDGDRRLYNGKRDTTLVRTSAAWDPEARVLSVTLPDGTTVAEQAAPGQPTLVEVYGRPLRGRVVAGPWADALSDLVGRSLTLVERDDGTWATDDRPASFVSRASLETIDGVAWMRARSAPRSSASAPSASGVPRAPVKRFVFTPFSPSASRRTWTGKPTQSLVPQSGAASGLDQIARDAPRTRSWTLS